MNWGHKIVVAFVLFAAFIGYMVVRAFQEDFDLVAEDYYAQEINYQDKIDKLNRTAVAEKEVLVQQVGKNVEITFPSGNVSGEIQFYHPSRKIFDRSFPISLDVSAKQTISGEELIAGNYRVKISWENEGEEYYQQSSIYIQ